MAGHFDHETETGRRHLCFIPTAPPQVVSFWVGKPAAQFTLLCESERQRMRNTKQYDMTGSVSLDRHAPPLPGKVKERVFTSNVIRDQSAGRRDWDERREPLEA